MDLYDRLNNQKKKILEPYKNKFKIFAQGPDVFFFYDLLCPIYGKDTRKLGSYMHQNKTQIFFVNLVTMIKSKKLEDNPEVLAFLYGLIAHYALDMTAHPFVLYKTGVFDKNNKSSYKYFGGHELMESYIDAYYMKEKGKINPRKFDVISFCFKDISISNTLCSLINDVFKQTFNQQGICYKYRKSIKQMKCFYHLFRTDRFGIKKIIYKLGQILPFDVELDAISYHIKLDRNDYYLNLNKESWHHPLNKKDIYNYSFDELYSIALSTAVRLISEVDKVLLNKKDIRYLHELFPNLSYATGRDCKLGKGSYFSF
jgi:uncharacterized membrane protein YbaN (DUF454 family)